ncbi:MAG: hypothetical protein WD749_13820 [Phycisphaerales bacterium]
MSRRRACALAAPMSLFLAAGAAADIFPTTAPTAGGNTIPFGTSTDYHEVFASSLFSNITAGQPALITRIALAPLNNLRYRTGLVVRLGYSAVPPGSLVAPPDNTGTHNGAPNSQIPPGMTDFYVAPAYLNVFQGASDTNFQAVLEGTPFVYDPALGDLLVELVVSNPTFSSLQMSATSAPGEASRAYFNTVASAFATQSSGVLRMNFTFSAHNPANTGACCAADGTCSSATIAACGAAGGVYKGDSIACASGPCPQPGACCKTDGTCDSILRAACIGSGGTWHGAGEPCSTVTCAQPGACCAPDGTCANTLAADCIALGSSWKPTACGVQACAGVLVSPHGVFVPPFNTGNTSSSVANVGLYLDLTAAAGANLAVSRIDYNSNIAVGTPVSATVYARDGTYLGFDGSPDGWRSLGTFNVISNGTSTTNPPVHLDLPSPLFIQQGTTAGVVIVAHTGGLRMRNSAANASNADLTLTGNHRRAPVFTGTAVANNGFSGAVVYDPVPLTATGACCAPSGACSVVSLGDCLAAGGVFRGEGVTCAGANCPAPACYANCDNSTQAPVLNVADFGCFLTRYAAGEAYANCDESTQAPVLNVADFGCFLTKYAAGCR